MVCLLQGRENFLSVLHRYMEVHGTVYFEMQRPPEVPAFVKNHGLLPQQELQLLLRRAKVRAEGQGERPPVPLHNIPQVHDLESGSDCRFMI